MQVDPDIGMVFINVRPFAKTLPELVYNGILGYECHELGMVKMIRMQGNINHK